MLNLNAPRRSLLIADSSVAAAEVVRHFMPKMVELHNYSPANAISQKIYNWNTLNRAYHLPASRVRSLNILPI